MVDANIENLLLTWIIQIFESAEPETKRYAYKKQYNFGLEIVIKHNCIIPQCFF